jgi:3-hydroxyisobutyrate dehydrogenase-like beta-hydroxyacid dehydrogenase
MTVHVDSDRAALPSLGFVGLGVMGTPMATHLASAGYPLTVYDIDAATGRALAAAHPQVTVAGSLTEMGAVAQIVITMLPDGHVVREVVTGPGGLAETLAVGSLLIDTSSAQPWLTRETAAALESVGVGMVDAPVSGAEWGAQAADLVFMVGGSSQDLARARPIFDVLGRATFHLGPLGSGHMTKCINNLVTAMTFQGTLEGLALGVAAGLDPSVMTAVFNESTSGSWITRNHIEQRILTRTFDDPFRLSLMRKDVDIAADLARQHELELPMTALVEASYDEADDQEDVGSSLSNLALWTERNTGVVVGTAAVVESYMVEREPNGDDDR